MRERVLTPDDPNLNLTCTRVDSAILGGRGASDWFELLCVAHRHAQKRWGADRVRRDTLSDTFQGFSAEQTFVDVPGLDYQLKDGGRTASWRQTFHLAKELETYVKVTFHWLSAEEMADIRGFQRWLYLQNRFWYAAHPYAGIWQEPLYPGDHGVLVWEPKVAIAEWLGSL